MNKLKIIVLLLLITLPFSSFSQRGISHSLGVIAEAIQFRSDYGQRDNTRNNYNNTGLGIAFIDYMSFSYNDNSNSYFKEHFKIRNQFSYSKTYLQHYGEWVEKNSISSKQLKAMRGSTQFVSLGSQFEYNFKHIHDFENTIGSFNPYIAIGPQINYYTATATSELGELGNVITTYPKYLVPSDGRPHGFSNESNMVYSIALNLGIHYKLTRMSDLVLDLRAQYFGSDWVDGLNPNKDLFKENKGNDWLTSIGIGYVFYLEK
ncbi:THC0290_0291 family protein [Flavobacterium sp. WC2509]|uniref:THC0290_0291 family protein n=1 Tax=Flavobacterium sp. WC2509 TaxID=3461406 RepID=UPI004044B619